MENYIFFIGGTGARVLRSFLHLCASGAVWIDGKITAIMLDVDSENYACTEAKELYDIYRENYSKLNSPRVQDVLKGAVVSAFRPYLEMPSGGAYVINPITEANSTLDLVASGSRRALEWFYTEEERNQSLKHGFFAHPNIGCLFFEGARSALLSYINNIADCMLVLVLGFLVALVARYGVDLQAPAEEQEDLVGIEMNMDSDADGEIDDHFESAGTVYRDTQTGKYYLID